MSSATQADREEMRSFIPPETRVVLRLAFGGCSSEELEDWAIVVQEVIDAADPELGAAVSGSLDPMTVQVLFTVENATRAQVHQRVAAVVGAIEGVVPTRFDTDAATRSAEPGQLVPA